MPSGFQQDQNQLTPGFYRVVINMGAIGEGSSANWSSYQDAPYDGRITPVSWDACSHSSITNLSDQYIPDALARGNLRFQAIVETLSNIADCQILDIECYANDDIENQANNGSLAFTVKFERNEAVGPSYNKIQEQDDALGNDYSRGWSGTNELDGITYKAYWSASGYETTIDPTYPEQAIRDLVWRAITRPTWSRSARVYSVSGMEGLQSWVEVGNPANGSDGWRIYEDITVQELDGTSTTITLD